MTHRDTLLDSVCEDEAIFLRQIMRKKKIVFVCSRFYCADYYHFNVYSPTFPYGLTPFLIIVLAGGFSQLFLCREADKVSTKINLFLLEQREL